ncbi:MAG: type IV conjugative transfer system protein TraL [Chlamydiales bacterium]|nr:type IV conjugative transfer system protein TraL [Chlamydiales bacterium]MBY0529897.1 type IV conjugative transfer system protein TraL [Rhabdochlamydiaceae bacterium]
MTQKQTAVIKYLDNPIRVLSFSIPDLIAYLSPFFVGSFFDSMFVIPFAGLVGVFIVKRVLQRLPRLYLFRFWYWRLPTKSVNRMCKSSFPSSNKRYWVR